MAARRWLAVWCAAVVVAGTARALPPIKHVVVLMQENRSFDHFLGFLKRDNPELEGLNGDESNPYDPRRPELGNVTVSNDAAYYTDPDPGHGVSDVIVQAYGAIDADQNVEVPPMNGYVINYANDHGAPNGGADVMRCFDKDSIPATSTLALEFGVVDHWFCSVAGPTMPNRYYLMSATSAGIATNAVAPIIIGFEQKSLFKLFEEAGLTWASYYALGPSPLVYKDIRERAGNFHHFSQFAEDARLGQLPTFTHIDPRYFSTERIPANDDHPSNNALYGQFLVKEIYEALRASPAWNDTLFIITYDEHGGLYDHVPTPADVPNPDGLVSQAPAFNFTRLGPRVPAIFISPWIDRGAVVHRPTGPYPDSQFDHTSIAATMKKMFNLPSFLTQRDQWAGTFEGIFSTASEPRTDCPMTLPTPRPIGNRKTPTGQEPLTALQMELVDIFAAVNGITESGSDKMNSEQGAHYVRKMVNRFFGRNVYPAEEWDPSWDWNAD